MEPGLGGDPRKEGGGPGETRWVWDIAGRGALGRSLADSAGPWGSAMGLWVSAHPNTRSAVGAPGRRRPSAHTHPPALYNFVPEPPRPTPPPQRSGTAFGQEGGAGAAAQACRLLEAGSWARPSVRCSTQADAVAGLGPCRRVTGGDALANVQTAAQGLRAHRQHPGLLTAPSWPWPQPLTARGRCGSRSARGAPGEAPGGSLGLCLPGLLTVVMPRRGSRCSRGWKPEAPIGAGEGSGIPNGFQGFQGTHWCLLQPPRLFLVIYGPPVVVSLQSREQKGILRIIFPSQCPPGHSLEPRRRGEDAAPPQNAAPQHGPEGGLIYVSQTSGSLQWLLSSPYPRGMAYFPRCAPRVTLRPPGGRRLLRHLKGAP